MARKKSPFLTEAELEIMEVLWTHGPCRVRDVVQHLAPRRPKAYTTVLTLLQILEEKGYVRHQEDERAHVFYPVVDRREARRQAVSYLLHRFFAGSPELLAAHLFEEHDLAQAFEKAARARKKGKLPREGP